MILDLNKFTLRFKVNNVDYGIAFHNIRNAKYRAAVWLYNDDDFITIIE